MGFDGYLFPDKTTNRGKEHVSAEWGLMRRVDKIKGFNLRRYWDGNFTLRQFVDYVIPMCILKNACRDDSKRQIPDWIQRALRNDPTLGWTDYMFESEDDDSVPELEDVPSGSETTIIKALPDDEIFTAYPDQPPLCSEDVELLREVAARLRVSHWDSLDYWCIHDQSGYYPEDYENGP